MGDRTHPAGSQGPAILRNMRLPTGAREHAWGNREVSETAVGKQSSRVPALDGLRGAAALVVVFHHLSLLFGSVNATYFAPRSAEAHPPAWSLDWWVTSTPAQLLVAGPQAVLVFFVLSGLVVALPVLTRPTFSWISYYPQRLTRLYVPAAASVVLALAIRAVADALAAPGAAPAMAVGTSWQDVIGGLDLAFGNLSINVPLWSLRWEVVFSVALPLFVVLAVAGRSKWLILTVLASAAAIIGNLNPSLTSFVFLPVFFIGTVIAVKFSSIRDWAANPNRTHRIKWIGFVTIVISILLTTSHATVVGLFPGKFRLQEAAASVEFVGCIGLVLVAAFWRPAARVLSQTFFQWLGRISFSLYLVHAPIIVAAYTIIGPGRPWTTVGAALVVSLVVAESFCRLVEIPSHKLSRRMGASSSSAMTEWFRPSDRLAR